MHRYTAEILYHFECDLCHLWWSYAVSPTKLTNYNLIFPWSFYNVNLLDNLILK